MLRDKDFKYICVSKSKLKDYQSCDLSNPTIIYDKKGLEIKLKTIVNEETADKLMYVESEGKMRKEDSMHAKAVGRFILEIEGVKKAVGKKGGTKKTEKVCERIGRIKERNKRVHGAYEIDIRTDNEHSKLYQ